MRAIMLAFGNIFQHQNLIRNRKVSCTPHTLQKFNEKYNKP